MKQVRIKGEHLQLQVISDLGDARAASSTLACSGTAADLLAVSDLEKISFFVKRGKIVKAYHPG